MKQRPLKELYRFLKMERSEIATILNYGAVVAILSFSVPLGVQAIVSTVAYTNLAQPIIFLALAVLAGQVLGAAFKTLQILIVEKLQRRFFTLVAIELALRIPKATRNHSARFVELVNRFFDVVTIQKNVASLLLDGFSLCLQMVFGLALLAFYHPFLLAFDLFLIAGIAFTFRVLGKGAIEAAIEKSAQKYKVASWLEEIAVNPVTFSSQGARNFALEKADDRINRYLDARESYFRIVLRQMLGLLSLQAVMNSVLMGLGVWLIGKNQLSLGQLVAAEIVVSTVLYSLTRFQKHLEAFYDLAAATEKVGSLLSLEQERSGSAMPDTSQGLDIVFKDVSFEFGNGPKNLETLSFHCKPFSANLVLGPNGSGKSMVIDLLYGFLQPKHGYILINGVDSRGIAPELLREEIALVRGVELIPATIRENIVLGKEVSDSELASVLSALDLWTDILSLPNGIETTLSTSGAPLSVSQTERLMLARAIVRRPKLILIDESLDQMDPHAKSVILKTLFTKPMAFSVIVTSHSKDLNPLCDQTIDLQGRVPGRAA